MWQPKHVAVLYNYYYYYYYYYYYKDDDDDDVRYLLT